MSFTGTISTIMTAVVAEIPTATSDVGSRYGAERTAPPHVLWTPLTDAYGAAPKQSPSAAGLQRALVGVRTTFAVRCWGATYAAAVALRDAVLRAAKLAATTSALPSAGAWAQPDAMDAGEVVTIRMEFVGYVPEAAPTEETVTTVAFDTSGATAGDGTILVPSD